MDKQPGSSHPSHVIGAPPVLYNNPGTGKQLCTNASSQVIGAPPILYNDPGTVKPLLKTAALPSDVKMMEAKKLAQKAHEVSYLGQVMRGEKKMKRFVRSAGGEVWEDPSLAEWDPKDFRVFCGDLGKDVSDDLLTKTFRKYPSFQRARVVRDSRTNETKGYGFVSFKNAEDYVRACREMDGQYVGSRPIKMRKSQWKDRSLNVVKKRKKEKKRLGLV